MMKERKNEQNRPQQLANDAVNMGDKGAMSTAVFNSITVSFLQRPLLSRLHEIPKQFVWVPLDKYLLDFNSAAADGALQQKAFPSSWVSRWRRSEKNEQKH